MAHIILGTIALALCMWTVSGLIRLLGWVLGQTVGRLLTSADRRRNRRPDRKLDAFQHGAVLRPRVIASAARRSR
jgi:hypothetical protein